MKTIKLLCFFLWATTLYSQEVLIVDFEGFKPHLEKNNDTTYVINFWATWCIPCIKELPEFEKINQKFRNNKFKMLLVSLDFKPQIDSKLLPFIKKNDIKSEVILLSDPNSNEWINKVNNDWTGSIPATVIYNNDYYYFREGSMTFDELNEIITKNLKK